MKPAQNFAPELLLKAQGSGLGMKAAIFDVDGVPHRWPPVHRRAGRNRQGLPRSMAMA
jgi:hypothetical protein